MSNISFIIDKIIRRIGKSWQILTIFFLKVRGAQVGKKVKIYGAPVFVGPRKNLVILESAVINHGVILNCRAPIKIGKHVHVSNYAQLHSGSLKYWEKNSGHIQESIEIGNYSWIAAGAIILSGVSLPEGSVVPAGTVVNKKNQFQFQKNNRRVDENE